MTNEFSDESTIVEAKLTQYVRVRQLALALLENVVERDGEATTAKANANRRRKCTDKRSEDSATGALHALDHGPSQR
jgi:hypothetical protein